MQFVKQIFLLKGFIYNKTKIAEIFLDRKRYKKANYRKPSKTTFICMQTNIHLDIIALTSPVLPSSSCFKAFGM